MADATSERGLFDVPNLDAFDREADLRHAGGVFSRLAAYCEHKARAVALRRCGDVEAALSYERAADTQYKQLPDWAKW